MKSSVQGLDKLLKKLDKLGNGSRQRIDQIAEGVSFEIQLDAVQRAPVNFGRLRQSIRQRKIEELKYEVVVGADYGAFVEFGTGVKVQIPQEFAAMAAQFRSRGGSFQDGLNAIKDWCRAKGIDEKLATIIFFSILRKGIQPQPYLYPAFVAGRIQFKQDLQNLLKELTK